MSLAVRGIYLTSRSTDGDEGNWVYTDVIRALHGCLMFVLMVQAKLPFAFIQRTNLISEM